MEGMLKMMMVKRQKDDGNGVATSHTQMCFPFLITCGRIVGVFHAFQEMNMTLNRQDKMY